MAFKKQATTEKKLDQIKKTANSTANKVYGEKPKQKLNKNIPLYLTEEQHENLIRFTMEQKLNGGEFSNISILVRHLLDQFFKKD